MKTFKAIICIAFSVASIGCVSEQVYQQRKAQFDREKKEKQDKLEKTASSLYDEYMNLVDAYMKSVESYATAYSESGETPRDIADAACYEFSAYLTKILIADGRCSQANHEAYRTPIASQSHLNENVSRVEQGAKRAAIAAVVEARMKAKKAEKSNAP